MHLSRSVRFTFAGKVTGAIGLVVLADSLVFGRLGGPVPGLLALAWTGVMIAAVGPVRCNRAARIALAAAALLTVVLIDDPSPLSWSLFWVALSTAALLPRRTFDDAARWSQRLVLHAIFGLAAPFRDLRRVGRTRNAVARPVIRAVAAVVALPLIGGATFLALFAEANPIISDAFGRITLPSLPWTLLHALVWLVVIFAVWPSLRPHPAARLADAMRADPSSFMPDIPLATLSLSLITFNAVFALQNGLDLVFLWSGAPLPSTITLADYAHRGAYTLIAAALLAGLFVLVALRPNSASAGSPVLRRWLIVWIAQTLLLVASSILRLVDYIEAYSMTILRLSAMAWMVLVGVGLVLICWRLLAGRSTAWLINANALAATLVLGAASMVDLGATTAAWNVRHARTARDLDLCYLGSLGPSALLSLIALEKRVDGPRLRDRVAFVRAMTVSDTIEAQADPRSWTWRNARRLAAAQTMLGRTPSLARPTPSGRACDGNLFPPPPVGVAATPPAAAIPPARLTKGAEQ